MENTIEHPKKRAFLAAYSRCANISMSAKRAKVDRGAHYAWMDKDPVYREAFRAAFRQAGDSLEDEASRRAFDGSDTLLIFLLKGFKPKRYKERHQVEHGGGIDSNVNVNVNVTARELLASRITSIAERKRAELSSQDPERAAV